jgi:hypothetical protein
MTVQVSGSASAAPNTLVHRADAIARHVKAEGLSARLLGGIAFHFQIRRRREHVGRAYGDIDLIVARKDTHKLDQVLQKVSYAGDKTFNARNGDRRLLFHHTDGSKLDVFVDTLEMCHRLPMRSRLDLETETVSRADLMLSKLQVRELNEKDLDDIFGLLAVYPVTATEDGINATHIGRMCGQDWGLHRTSEVNLSKLRDNWLSTVAAPDRRAVAQGLEDLADALASARKTTKWKLRAVIGERVRWYEDPEDVG